MKMYKCKIKGLVDCEGCFSCFQGRQTEQEFSSRVLCKAENVTEEVSVTEDIMK